MAAVLAGQRERFGELAERYKDAVVAVARGYVRDRHAAEDLAQEVFLKAFSALGQLREPRLFLPWLLQIARHSAAQAAQRRERQQGLNLRPLTGTEAVAAPVEPEEERLFKVLSLVEQLPEPYRQTILLKYQGRRSCKEIAAAEDVAVGTVTSRLTRALAMLREALKDSG